MPPLNNEQKESIIKRISFIIEELKDLSEYKNIDWQIYNENRKRRKELERTIENIVNATIDIAKFLLAGEEIVMPDTYLQIFIKLKELNFINEEDAKSITKSIKLRNLLAHEYLDLRWPIIKEFINTGWKTIEKFINNIQNHIQTILKDL